MASFLDRLVHPDRAAEKLVSEIMRSLNAHANRVDAPDWVRALRSASLPPGHVVRGAGGHLDTRAAVMGAIPNSISRGVPRTHLAADEQVGSAFTRQAYAAGILPMQAREFARSNEWVRAAINKLKGRVSRAERAIVPINPDKPFDLSIRAQIAELIENPNPRLDSWRSFSEPWLEDVLTCGKGGWEYVKNWRGWPLGLYSFDCQYVKVLPGWDGSSPNEPRYAFGPPQKKTVGLKNEDATLLLLNPTTYRWEGLPPIEVLQNSIEADMAGNEFVRTMMQKYPPPGWIHLGESSTRKQVSSVAEQLTSDVLGQGGFLVTGGMKDPKFTSLWNGTSRENELMAWSIYFARKIAAVFAISPQDFGITMDINKSTAESQESMTAEDGYRAILLLVEEYVNREIIGKFGRPEQLNLCFRFKELTLKDRARQAKLVKDLMGDVPAVMLNEGRKELDLPPLELGNAIYVSTATGVSAIIGDDAEEFRRRRLEADAAQMEALAAIEHGPDGDDAAEVTAASGTEKPPNKSGEDTGTDAGQAKSDRPPPDAPDKATASFSEYQMMMLTMTLAGWVAADDPDIERAVLALRSYLRLATRPSTDQGIADLQRAALDHAASVYGSNALRFADGVVFLHERMGERVSEEDTDRARALSRRASADLTRCVRDMPLPSFPEDGARALRTHLRSESLRVGRELLVSEIARREALQSEWNDLKARRTA